MAAAAIAAVCLPGPSSTAGGATNVADCSSSSRCRKNAGGRLVGARIRCALAPWNHGIADRRGRRQPIPVQLSAVEDSSTSTTSTSTAEAGDAPGDSWVPVIPFSALPRGERRLIRQDGDTVLLLWYKDEVYALENTSPAEGAYSEGLYNARLTGDGCIVCPSTETTFDLKTGAIKDWYPTNPILAFLTKPTRELTIYPVKADGQYVYINTKKGKTGESAEIVFGGQTQAGKTATDVNVDEVRMVVEENGGGFGFTPYTELVNGRAAMVGVTMLLLTELVTGQGFLKGLGFLDFLYKFIQ